jgi:plastocyanin
MKKIISTIIIAGMAATLLGGDLTGTVTYEGKAPKRKTLRMDSDPVCGAAHQAAVHTESFIVDENGNLANVLIYLKNASADTVPSESAVIDQKGCMYAPHVIGVQAGQEVKFLNSDTTMHNIHGLPKVNKEFNFGMPKTVKEKSVTFDKPEDVFVIKCDVHPWMKSYVHVFDHPYFAVSGTDGKYAISGVPEGEYEVVAWQEKFGSKRTLTQTVTIGDDSTMSDFKFVKPSKK